MNDWDHVSASQLSMFTRCQRKWFYKYIVGLPYPVGPAAKLGKRVHACLEQRLKTGVWADDDPKVLAIAKSGEKHLPQASIDRLLDIEKSFTFSPPDSPVPFVGFIDVLDPSKTTVIDHKTTGNLHWAKSEQELSIDPQAIIYSYYAWRELGWAAPVTFRHIYYCTSQRASMTTDCVLTEQDLATKITTFVDQAKAMSELSGCTSVEDAPANTSACGDYGGCPFRGQCPAIKTKKETEMSSGISAFEAIMAKAKAKAIATHEAKPMGEAVTKKVEEGDTVEAVFQDESDNVANEKGADADAEATTKRKRGRPAAGPFLPDGRQISKLKKAELVQALTEILSDPEFEAGVQAAKEERHVDKTTIFIDLHQLFIGCIPRHPHHHPIYLDSYLADIYTEVAKAEGVDHYLCVEYGKGPKLVAGRLAAKLRDGMEYPLVMIADPQSPATAPCVEVLAAYYHEVIHRWGA